MKRMTELKKLFTVPVGYSDHTMGIEMPIMAVTLGAEIIEKHLTLSRKSDGPDHFCSSEPKEFQQMVLAIRNVEQARCGKDYFSKNIEHLRRSISAARDLQVGERILEDDIKFLRPAEGLPPKYIHNVLGKILRNPVKAGEKITLDDVRCG